MAFKILAEGMSISAASGTLETPQGTISCWLRREGRRFKKLNDDKLQKLKKEKLLEGVLKIFLLMKFGLM